MSRPDTASLCDDELFVYHNHLLVVSPHFPRLLQEGSPVLLLRRTASDPLCCTLLQTSLLPLLGIALTPCCICKIDPGNVKCEMYVEEG
jgi:hypothetical protein